MNHAMRTRSRKTVWVWVAVWGLIILIASLLLARPDAREEHDKKQVLTTFTVLADMAHNVGGDVITVNSLTKAGAEIHGYEPTPRDMVRAQQADLILDNGMGLEKWAEKLYSNLRDVPHVTLTTHIRPVPIADGPYQDKPNPHAWMSPANAVRYVDAIATAFTQIDPDNTQTYKTNAERYKQRIRQVDMQLREALAQLPDANRYLVSCEGAFSYLVRDYALKEVYLWPINADAQGTPQQIRGVVETVRAHKIPAVFCESTVSDKAQRQVAKETGARYGGVFYVDSLSSSNGPTSTYLDLLQYNTDTLIKGLTQ